MRPRRVVGTLMVLTISLLGLAAGPGALPAAEAVTGSPPITTPDAVTVYTGNVATVQPVNNDHDPDNDQLALCRVGDVNVPGLVTENVGNDLVLLAKPRATPGTYTLTYYACDFSYLSPGTITVTDAKLPHVTLTKVAGNPGHLRVKNPADFSIRLLYGGRDENRPDGSVGVPAHSSKVFTVHRTEIVWIAFSRDQELLLGIGRGVVPSYYLRYFYAHDEVVREQLASPSRAAEVAEIERRLLELYADPALDEKPELLGRRGGAFYSEAAVQLAAALLGDGAPSTHVVNLRNGGTLPFLPDDAVIEVPAHVDRSGMRAVDLAPLDPLYAGLVTHVTAYEHLALDAALRGGRKRVFEALLAHPLVGQVELADQLTDRLIAHNREHLPWA